MKTILTLAGISLLLSAPSAFAADQSSWGQVKQQIKQSGTDSAVAAKASQQETTVREWGSGDDVDGATASLVRNKNVAHMKIDTKELTAEYTYTVWAVIFENPAACDDNCNGPDLGDPAVDATIVGPIAGKVADANGDAKFIGHMKKGDTNYNDNLFGDGSLDNPQGAEIHFIIRCHGPVIPELLDEQLGSFNGGCDINTCEDVQFGIFKP